jgi:cytochrome c553
MNTKNLALFALSSVLALAQQGVRPAWAFPTPDKEHAALASSGIGKTVTCAVCHGEGLKGLGDVPRIAGLHPIYIVRQLSSFQTGASAGSAAALMKRVVANLTEDDMIALAAYAASLNP